MQLGPRHVWAVSLILTVLYFIVRLLDVGLFVTTDEPFWLGRSANFYRALASGEFEHTYQMAHPGILTMWAGAIGYWIRFPEFADLAAGNLDYVYGIGDLLREMGADPMSLLVDLRISKMVLQSIAFLGSMVLLSRLLGLWVAGIAGALMALDPFLSGHDSLLHVDGLFTILALLAVLALAEATRSGHHALRPWLVAGVCAALAWLTRATGLIIAILAIVGAFMGQRSERPTGALRSLRSRLEPAGFSFALWLVGGIVATIVLLPALWVEPLGTIGAIWDWNIGAADEGHERPIFFAGRVISGDPGLDFYPVTMLWHLTPPVLVGLLAALVLFPFASRRGWLTRDQWRTLALLAGFGLIYFAAMSFGAKKFDRYLLPVYPIVMVFAAQGAVLAARLVSDWRPRFSRIVLPFTAAILLVPQVASLGSALPYRLDYFSPILGGAERAQTHIQMGWGESANEAIDYIVAQAQGNPVTVQVSSNSAVYIYLAPDNLQFASFGLATPAGWYETDYFVAGIQEWQRNLSPSYQTMQAYGYEPAHIVSIDGVAFFLVYAPRQLPLPAHLIDASHCSAEFEGAIRLMQIIDRDDAIDFYWLSLAAPATSLEARVTIVDRASGGEIQTFDWIDWEPAQEGLVSQSRIATPDREFAGTLSDYDLVIQLRDPATGDLLPISSDTVTDDRTSALTHSECFYGP